MGAGIDEGVELTLTVARNEDRLPAHLGGVVVVIVGNLTLMGQINPVTLEDMLHLQLKQRGIGKGAAMQAVIAAVLVFHQETVEAGQLWLGSGMNRNHCGLLALRRGLPVSICVMSVSSVIRLCNVGVARMAASVKQNPYRQPYLICIICDAVQTIFPIQLGVQH